MSTAAYYSIGFEKKNLKNVPSEVITAFFKHVKDHVGNSLVTGRICIIPNEIVDAHVVHNIEEKTLLDDVLTQVLNFKLLECSSILAINLVVPESINKK